MAVHRWPHMMTAVAAAVAIGIGSRAASIATVAG